MYYVIDVDRRRIILWRKSYRSIKMFMLTHNLEEDEHTKIVKEIN